MGSTNKTLQAKIFGGASMNTTATEAMMIGQKNILVAKEILKEYKISIVAEDVGGQNGRKIQFDLERNKVLLKYTQRSDMVNGR
jgi:chemotaxis protein CheD